MLDLTEYINNRSLLNGETLEELSKLVNDYPFYQLARLLYVLNLHVMNDGRYEKELQKASIFIPDRSTLFWLIEQSNYDVEKNVEESLRHNIETEDDDRTISLIDDYLSTQEPDNDVSGQSAQPHSVPTVAEVTSDYGAFLQMQVTSEEVEQKNMLAQPNDDEVLSQQPQLKGATLIDNFIEERKGKQRYEIAQLDEVDDTVPSQEIYDPIRDLDSSTDHETVADLDVYNENIVSILIKQGKYEQGLLILKKICLNNPEKSVTFANQMRLLEVIIRQKSEAEALHKSSDNSEKI